MMRLIPWNDERSASGKPRLSKRQASDGVTMTWHTFARVSIPCVTGTPSMHAANRLFDTS